MSRAESLCLRIKSRRGGDLSGRSARSIGGGAAAGRPPFAEQRLEVVARVSEKLLGRQSGSTSSFIKHFGFWIRRAALAKLAANFDRRLPPQARALPCGVVFHLPPQNVEAVSYISWVLSYLVGNANVTRVPTNFSDPIRGVCDLFLEQLKQAGDPSQFFIHYDAKSALNGLISAISDARVVWGGDEKVGDFFRLCRCATAASQSGSATVHRSRW